MPPVSVTMHPLKDAVDALPLDELLGERARRAAGRAAAARGGEQRQRAEGR